LASTNVEAASVAGEGTTPASEELLPAGTINFPATDLNQVLVIFQALADRTLLQAPALPRHAISFYTQTPVTRGEAIQSQKPNPTHSS
jgi:hypothetical protein